MLNKEELNGSICNHSLSKNEFKALLTVYCTSGSICSFLCAVAIIAMLLFRLFKTLTNRLILNTLVSIFFMSSASASQFFGLRWEFWQSGHTKMCIAEGVLGEYSSWVMLLSTLMMTLHLTVMVLYPSLYEKMAKMEPLYLLFPWIFPLLVSWIPFLLRNYGVVGPWCWIQLHNENCSLNKEGIIEIYAVLYGEQIIGLILNNIALVIVGLTMCKRAYIRNTTSLAYRKALKQTLPLLAYPITYQILSIFAIANLLYMMIHKGRYNIVMFYAHAATSPSWGIFAPFVTFTYLFLLRKEIKTNARKWPCFKCCLKCYRKQRQDFYEDIDDTHNQIVRPLITSHDILTEYGLTITTPTTFDIRRESEVDDECVMVDGIMKRSRVSHLYHK